MGTFALLGPWASFAGLKCPCLTATGMNTRAMILIVTKWLTCSTLPTSLPQKLCGRTTKAGVVIRWTVAGSIALKRHRNDGGGFEHGPCVTSCQYQSRINPNDHREGNSNVDQGASDCGR